MQRDLYNTVTVPLLIEVPRQWAEGEAYVDDDRVKVREFTDDDIDQEQECGRQNWLGVSRDERLRILQVANIIRSLQVGDQLGAQKAMLGLREATSGSAGLAFQLAKRMIHDTDYIPDSLCYQIYHQLADIRFVLWKRLPDRRLSPGLFCATVESALWVRALMSAIGGTAGFRICTKCGRAFWQKRSDQEYCSMKCREAHRVERWRARNRANATKDRRKR